METASSLAAPKGTGAPPGAPVRVLVAGPAPLGGSSALPRLLEGTDSLATRWTPVVDEARKALLAQEADVVLVDGCAMTEAELVELAASFPVFSPLVVLVPVDGARLHAELLAAGVADVCATSGLTSTALRRTIDRVALQQARVQAAVSAEARLREALAAAREGAFDWDLQHRRIVFSGGFSTLFDTAPAALGDRVTEWLGRMNQEDVVRFQAALDAHVAGATPEFRCEHRLRRRDGREIWALAHGRVLRDALGQARRVVGTVIDITSFKDVESRLRSQAHEDELTGLLNRRSLVESLDRAVALAKRHGEELSLCLADLDDFKRINDVFGHLAGDDALAAFGRVIKGRLRTTDLAGRYGGDEFALVFPRTSASAAKIAVERLRLATRGELAPALPPGAPSLTASFGIAEFKPGVEDGAELFRRADVALYRAKNHGGDRTHLAGEPNS